MTRDSEIEQRVLHTLRLSVFPGVRELCVFSSNGVITLAGTVRTKKERLAVQAVVLHTADVAAVINRLGLHRPLRDRRARAVAVRPTRPARRNGDVAPRAATAGS